MKHLVKQNDTINTGVQDIPYMIIVGDKKQKIHNYSLTDSHNRAAGKTKPGGNQRKNKIKYFSQRA